MSGALKNEPSQAADGHEIELTVRLALAVNEGVSIRSVKTSEGEARALSSDGSGEEPKPCAGASGGIGDGDPGQTGGETTKAGLGDDRSIDADAISVVAGAADGANTAAETLSASDHGKESGPEGPGASAQCNQCTHTGPRHGSEYGPEVLERIKGLTIGFQDLRRDLEARSLERELLPIFRPLFGIVWFLVKTMDERDVGEAPSGDRVILQGVADSLRQLLQFHGIEMFRAKPGDPFDVATMRFLSSAPANPKSAFVVEESCRPGFRLGQRVLECELVKVKLAEGGPEHPSADHHILREHVLT